MDKTKKAPIPERKSADGNKPKSADPTYIRGTIEPPVKKKES